MLHKELLAAGATKTEHVVLFRLSPAQEAMYEQLLQVRYAGAACWMVCGPEHEVGFVGEMLLQASLRPEASLRDSGMGAGWQIAGGQVG